jgi:hypothetical protein
MRSFNPIVLGRHECRAWVGYYRKEWLHVLRASIGMVREGFGMGWIRDLRGAYLVLRANQAWAPFPENDPDKARKLMRKFYALVARTHGEHFDPTEAARREVEWWRAHRDVQRRSEGSEDAIVAALTNLYSYVYDVPPESVREAARHRAEAMRISDDWVALGCDADSPMIVAEQTALVRSYAALLAGVHVTSRRGTGGDQ